MSKRWTPINKWLIFLLLNSIHIMVFAQTQRNLFFNAKSTSNITRLDFDFSPPIPFDIGVGGDDPLWAEGIAHFEDGSGVVLFFFNSDGVYDNTFEYMDGSAGILANASAAEINICPNPSNPDQYYILYNNEQCSSLYYSIVDMSTSDDDGSIGDVVVLNQLVDTNAGNSYMEGIEIVEIPDTDDYWFLAFRCFDGIYKFLIDDTGIGAPQLIQPFGTFPGAPNAGNTEGRGEFDYHNGRIAIAFNNTDRVFTSEFEPINGDICNPLMINDPLFGYNNTTSNGPYGVEFSPDASKLYITSWLGGGSNIAPELFRYNFTTSNLTPFLPDLGPDPVEGFGQIELGRDGFLYVAIDEGTNILQIENPNAAVPAFNLIALAPGVVTDLGISDHIQSSVFDENATIIDTCAITGEIYTLTPFDQNYSYEFVNADDPTTILFTGQSYDYLVGNDYEQIIANALSASACVEVFNSYTYNIYPTPAIDASPDVSILTGSSYNIPATSNVPAATYTWSPATGLDNANILTPTATLATTTTYIVEASFGGCTSTDTITINVVDDEILEEEFCLATGTAVNLELPDTLINIEWYNADDPTTILGTGSTYSATATDAIAVIVGTGDSPTDPSGLILQTTIVPEPVIDATANISLLNGDSYTIPATSSVPSATYSWSPATGLDNANVLTPTANPTVTTTYTLTATVNGVTVTCSSTDQITITVVDDEVNNEQFCLVEGQSTDLNIATSLINPQWYNANDPTTILGTDYSFTVIAGSTTEVYVGVGESPDDPSSVITQFTVIPEPDIDAGPDQFIEASQFATIQASGGDVSGYNWVPDPTLTGLNASNPVANPIFTTTYTLNSEYDPQCPASDEVTVFVINISSAINDSLCAIVGEDVALNVGNANFQTVEWVNMNDSTTVLATGPTFNVDGPPVVTVYKAIGTDEFFNITNYYFTLLPNPVISAGIDRTILEGESYTLQGSGGSNYEWSPDSLFINADITNPNATISPLETVTLTLTNTTEDGCSLSDQVTITVKSESFMLIPSGFSPNNDGVNDLLSITPFNVNELISFEVYNRWGQLLFATNNLEESWDGRYKGVDMEVGVYVYVAKAIAKDGTEYIQKGNTSLIR